MTFDSSPYSQPARHSAAFTPDRPVLRRLHTVEVSMNEFEADTDMDEAGQRVAENSVETLGEEECMTGPVRVDVDVDICMSKHHGDECVDLGFEGDGGQRHDHGKITEEGGGRNVCELVEGEQRQCPEELDGLNTSAGSPLAVNALEQEGDNSSIGEGDCEDTGTVFAPSGFSSGFSSGKSYVPTASIYDMGVNPLTDTVELLVAEKSQEQGNDDTSTHLEEDEGTDVVEDECVFAPSGFSTGFSSGKSFVPTSSIYDTAATDQVTSPVEHNSSRKYGCDSSPAVTCITKTVYDGFSSGKTFVPTADIYEMGRSVPPGDDLEAKEVELEVPRESLLDKGSTLHDESGRHGESYSPQGRDEDLAEDEDNGWDITPAKPSGLGGFGSASSFIPTADIYELGIVARPPEEDHVDPAYMGLPALRLPKSNAEEAHTTDKVMGYSQMIGERMVQEEMEKAGINGCPEDGTTNSAQQTRSEKTVQTHNDTRDLLGPARQKLVAFKFGAKSHVAIPQQPGKVEVSSVSRDRSVRVNEEKASMRLEDERGIQPDSRDSDSSESRKRRQYDDHEHGEVAECTDSRGKRARRAEVMTSAEVISGHDIARTCMPPPSKTKADQHRPTFLSPPPSETFTAPSAPRVIKPFTRTSYPDPLAPPSTILNLGSESLLRTCFRVGEVLRCSRSKDEERVMIIEFFGVLHSSTSSERTIYHPRPEYVLQLSDIFHPSRGPYLSGRCWHDVSNDVRVGDMTRVVGVARVTKDGKMELKVEKVRKATWSEIEYVRGIVN